MKRIFQVIFLWCCIPTMANAQINPPGLQELIDSALVQDATLYQQKLENRLTQLDQEKLNDLFLPKVEVAGKGGYLYSSVNVKSPEVTLPSVPNVFPGAVFPEGYFDNHLNVSGISAMANAKATMLLYSGGKVKYLKEANKEKAIAENILMDKSKEDIISNISKIYDQFALLDASAKVLEKSKARLELTKKTADKALGYGLITPYDHQKIELAQATLDSKMIEYEGKKELLLTQLYLLTGIDINRLSLIKPTLKPIRNTKESNTIYDRPEIKALDHGIKAIDYKIKSEQRWWIPKVVAQTSLTYAGLYNNHIATSKDLMPGSGKPLDWKPNNINAFPIAQVGVGFKWDLFDGHEGKHAVAKAKIEKQILTSKKENALELLQLNQANSLTQYKMANAQISLKQKSKEIAATALTNIEKEFRYGTKRSSDYIEAETDLQNAELEYQTAIFNQRRAAIEVMKATQELDINKL